MVYKSILHITNLCFKVLIKKIICTFIIYITYIYLAPHINILNMIFDMVSDSGLLNKCQLF